MFQKLLLLTAGLLFIVSTACSSTYGLDASHTQIHFSVTHLMVFRVRGNFNDFDGQVDIDTTNKTLTSANVTISTASVDTRNTKRDNHLKSADFFDVETYPEITFISKSVSGSDMDITVVGDLTIKGITKEIILNGAYVGATVDPWGNQRAGFAATGKVDRRDFGLTWNKALEAGGVVVGNMIELGLEVEAVAQK